jgi:acetylornithine deacetylase
VEPVVRLLADLVAIPSVNPMGRARSGNEYSEQSLAEFIAAFLKKHSVDSKLQQVGPNRPNVIGYIDAKASQTLLLEAHLDTVHADGMTIDPFSPLIRDDKLFGRGSCDTKSSIAAFLQAVVNVVQSRRQLEYNTLLLFVSDEEYRFTGARHAAHNGLKADVGIAGEPTQLRVVRAHKGVTRWRIVTKGLAAHSAYPDRGKNAIYAMSKVIKKLAEYAAELPRKKSHPMLGTPTLSVGVIEGGQAVNIVPDRCWIEVDRRTLPGENIEVVLDPVRDLLRDLPDWEFESPYLSVDGMEVAEDSQIVQILARSIDDVLGSVTIEAAQYATDAGIYNGVGIPTVVFGPGDITQAHTDSEFVELQQVRHAVNIIQRLLAP